MKTPLRFEILGVDTPDSMETCIEKALKKCGHAARVFLPGIRISDLSILSKYWYYLERLRQEINKALYGNGFNYLQKSVISHLRRTTPDVFIIVTLPIISARTIRAIKREIGCKVIGWYPDHMVNLGRADFLYADYDLIYFKDPYMVRRFGSDLRDDRVKFLLEGFDDELASMEIKDIEMQDYRCDIMIYGNVYPYRMRYLDFLKRYDLRIYGTPRLSLYSNDLIKYHYKRQIRGREKVIAAKSASVCLNNGYYGEIEGVNARLWELAGMGAFQLTNMEHAKKYFDPDNEVAYFTDVSDMIEKIDYYLHIPELRNDMARKAQEKALSQHTWIHRAKSVLKDISAL